MSIDTYNHHGHKWLVKLIVKFFKDAEDDALTQIKVHRWFIRFWMVNFVVALSVFIFLPDVWASASILYLTLVSLYANFATDYGALIASQGSLNALKAGQVITKEIVDGS